MKKSTPAAIPNSVLTVTDKNEESERFYDKRKGAKAFYFRKQKHADNSCVVTLSVVRLGDVELTHIAVDSLDGNLDHANSVLFKWKGLLDIYHDRYQYAGTHQFVEHVTGWDKSMDPALIPPPCDPVGAFRRHGSQLPV